MVYDHFILYLEPDGWAANFVLPSTILSTLLTVKAKKMIIILKEFIHLSSYSFQTHGILILIENTKLREEESLDVCSCCCILFILVYQLRIHYLVISS